MARLKRRKDGRIRKKITVDGVNYYIYGRTADELREKEEQKRIAIRDGLVQRKDPTLNQYYEHWINAQTHVKPATIRSGNCAYRSCAKQYIPSAQKTLGEIRLRDITAEDVRVMQNGLKRTCKNRTINDYTYHLSHILKDAVMERRIPFNPCQTVKALKDEDAPARETIHRALSESEQETFFKAARESYYYNAFCLMINTGMRSGEIGALKAKDIHDGFIHVATSLTRTEAGKRVLGTDAKTIASERRIPLNRAISDIIQSQKEQNATCFGNVVGIDDTLFKAPRGGLLVESNINREIRRICKRTEIELFTSHAFRATFATRCIEQEMPPKVLQEILGHKDFRMTMNLYTHVMDETKTSALMNIYIAT